MTEFTHSLRSLEFQPARAGVLTSLKWMQGLGLLLVGYAVFGKGFAYVGYSPAYVGEIVLLWGLVVLALSGRFVELLDARITWLLLAFCGWGVARTFPYISTDGADALRDAVIWGYCAFAAIVTALLLAQPDLLGRMIRSYDRATRFILIATPVVTVLFRALYSQRPTWPGTDIAILQQKEGDVLVHMAGIIAFWMAGLAGRVSWKWVILLAINVGIMGALDRAGMLAVVVVIGLCALARPRSTIPWRLALIAGLVVLSLWLSNLRIEIPGGKGREVSFDQFVTNVKSYASDTGDDGIDSTKEWRLDWWSEIVSYTIHGRYFWTGKGFGVNLADDDGFQVLSDGTLRAPHNIHMDVLARMGVPGLFLWAAVLLSIGGWGVHSFFHASHRCRKTWASLFLFLLAYWIACIINASFDVFIEGPMGGIWFWSLCGFLIGSCWLYQKCPDLLRESAT